MKKLIAVSILAASLVSGVAFAQASPYSESTATAGAEMEGISVIPMLTSFGVPKFAGAAAADGLTLTSITTTVANGKVENKTFTFTHHVSVRAFAKALSAALEYDGWAVETKGNKVTAVKDDASFVFRVVGSVVTLDLGLATDSTRSS